MTSEELQMLLDVVRHPETDLSLSFAIARARNELEDRAEDFAAELIAARAKLEAAERLAEAVRNIDESCLISDPEELGDMARAALTAWEAVK